MSHILGTHGNEETEGAGDQEQEQEQEHLFLSERVLEENRKLVDVRIQLVADPPVANSTTDTYTHLFSDI